MNEGVRPANGCRLIDKVCKCCGKMMYQVPANRQYCIDCSDERRKKRDRTRSHNRMTVLTKPKPIESKPDMNHVMSLSEIMHEATKEGLQYVEYCRKHDMYPY